MAWDTRARPAPQTAYTAVMAVAGNYRRRNRLVDNKQYWIRHITPVIYRFRGNPQKLLGELENLSVEALEQLYRLLQNIESDLRTAERTYRPFPGGPKMRL